MFGNLTKDETSLCFLFSTKFMTCIKDKKRYLEIKLKNN